MKKNNLLILTILFAGMLILILVGSQIALDHHTTSEHFKDAKIARDSLVIDSLKQDTSLLNHSEIK